MLCENAIEEEGINDWLAVSRGESEWSSFVDFDEVTRYFADFLNQKFPSALKVMYVCGLDHFNRCPYVAQLAEAKNIGCAVIYRPGSDEQRIRPKSNIYYLPLSDQRQELVDISSTMIRTGDMQNLEDLTYRCVIEYLKKH